MVTPSAHTQVSPRLVRPTRPVTLSWNNGAGQNFEIRYSIDENYMISAAQKVSNSGTGAIAVKSYGYVSRAAPSGLVSSCAAAAGVNRCASRKSPPMSGSSSVSASAEG